VGPRAGLDGVEKRDFLKLSGLKLRLPSRTVAIPNMLSRILGPGSFGREHQTK
jgi:hypothetical protein